MFLALVHWDVTVLETLALKLHGQDITSAALLALDYIFARAPKFNIASASEISSRLAVFQIYAQLLHQVTLTNDLHRDPHIWRLCALEPTTEDWFLVPKNTYLYPLCNDRLAPMRRVDERGYLLGSWDLEKVVRWGLQDRLRRRVMEMDAACRTSRAFRPCLPLLAVGRCPRENCYREHLTDEQIDEKGYNLRVRLHLQVILMYNLTRTQQANEEVVQQQLCVLCLLLVLCLIRVLQILASRNVLRFIPSKPQTRIVAFFEGKSYTGARRWSSRYHLV